MAKFAILFVCILVAVGLMLAAPVEYRFATITALIVLAIVDAATDESQKRHLLQFARDSLERIVLPPLSFVLWLAEITRDTAPIPRLELLKGGHSRAELKRRWVNSWMTAPARYFRSRIGGK